MKIGVLKKIINKIWIIILVFIFLFMITGLFFYVSKNYYKNIKVEAYFIDNTELNLKPETRKINSNNNNNNGINKKSVLYDAVNILFNEPKDKSLLRFKLKNLKLKNIDLDNKNNKTAVINFSKEYYDLDAQTELFFRAALVWTLTSLDFVDNIKILVNNHELKYLDANNNLLLSRDNIIINPEISDERFDVREFKLYFIKDNYLMPETRLININPKQAIEKYILEQIISGPKDSSLQKTLPDDIKIYEVKTDKDICYVSLSEDFINKNNNYNSQEFAIYSIVNSLTELEDINKVQFLIESEKVNQKSLMFDFHVFFEF